MITLTSDFNPERAEKEYEEEAQTMLMMALVAGGYTSVDISAHKYNVNQHVAAIMDEVQRLKDNPELSSTEVNPEVGRQYLIENGKKLTEYGVAIVNILWPAIEGQYPLIKTSVYNGFEEKKLVAEIHRPMVVDDDEQLKLYDDNAYGYGYGFDTVILEKAVVETDDVVNSQD